MAFSRCLKAFSHSSSPWNLVRWAGVITPMTQVAKRRQSGLLKQTACTGEISAEEMLETDP